MLPEFSVLKRTLLLLLAFLCIGLLFLSCGTSGGSSSSTPVSGIAHRAYVSQDVSGGSIGAGIEIVDETTDLLSLTHVITAGNTPGMMVVTPNRNQTLVFSGNGTQGSDNVLTIINNATESGSGTVSLQGMTQSFVVSPDSTTAYVAVPTLTNPQGQQPGAIDVVSLANGAIVGRVYVPAVRYLSISHSGTRILGFSDNSDSVAVVTPSNIQTGNAVTYVSGFNAPVQGFFTTDDNTAYVVNCGANCGGTQASVQTLDLTQNPPLAGTPVNVPAAEAATIVGTTMYLAGTPVPASPCTGEQTQATTCGLVTVFDLPSMTVTQSGIIITDGYHDHIAMGANGQLFVGAHNCTEILPSGSNTETRGCLSIYNTQTGAVVIPPSSGDVTGLQPIPNRHVVYLVQKNITSGTPVGELEIFDTTTDQLQVTQVDISGDAVDVISVDF